jgi:hypothetical protein
LNECWGKWRFQLFKINIIISTWFIKWWPNKQKQKFHYWKDLNFSYTRRNWNNRSIPNSIEPNHIFGQSLNTIFSLVVVNTFTDLNRTVLFVFKSVASVNFKVKQIYFQMDPISANLNVRNITITICIRPSINCSSNERHQWL